MNTKLKIEKMAEAINYYYVQKSFYKKNGDELSIDDLLAKDMDEDDFPWNIKDFKKLGYGFSKAEFYCNEDNKDILYSFSNDEKSIIIDSENFSLKEFIIIVDMIKRHLEAIGAGQFISFGRANEDTHTLYHEEGTVFGLWWEEFYRVYKEWLDDDTKQSQIQIFTDDYQTDDERYYTKDRVIHIVLF